MEETVEQRSRKRRALLLRERVTVIEMYSTRPRPNYETLAKMFNCGRSQIKNILRQKGQILQEYEKNPESDRVRRVVPGILLALNHMVDEWVKRAICHKVVVDEKAIIRKAVEVQKFLDYEEFEPSKIWLRSFKRRHGYYRVDLRTMEAPSNKLKSLKLRDIYEDVKDALDPSIICATDLKLTREQNCCNDSYSDQYEQVDLKDHLENTTSDFSADEVVIRNEAEALEYLKPLEEFALLTENFRAIGLISQLETILRGKIRVARELDTLEEN